MAKEKPREWVEQAIIVKKTHPFAHTKEEAVQIAERHSKNGFEVTVEYPKTYRVIQRPSRCFRMFRADKRGDHVTVIWGKLKKGARRSKDCR